jgi:branched-chain amino acid aminotransferase
MKLMGTRSTEQIAFIDGKIFKGDRARIPVNDLGLQRGYAAFDYARVYNGKLFHFRNHLERFRKSAAGLHLALPYPDEQITENAQRLVSKIGIANPGLRLILTGGSAHVPSSLRKPRFIMIAEELPRYPADVYKQGARLITYEFLREVPHIKTTNYMNAFRLEPHRLQRQAFDILYCWNGRVLECPRDNFFIFRGNTLITANDNVLHGITRAILFDLVKDRFKVEERDVGINELDVADEALITSTTKQVVPVIQIDQRTLSGGVVGRRARMVMEEFHKYIENY